MLRRDALMLDATPTNLTWNQGSEFRHGPRTRSVRTCATSTTSFTFCGQSPCVRASLVVDFRNTWNLRCIYHSFRLCNHRATMAMYSAAMHMQEYSDHVLLHCELLCDITAFTSALVPLLASKTYNQALSSTPSHHSQFLTFKKPPQ